MVVTGLLARSQLTQARADLVSLRHGLLTASPQKSRELATAANQHARRAHSLTGGPAWAVLSSIPVVGRPLDSVRALTSSAHEVTSRVVPALLDVKADLDPAKLRSGRDQVDLHPIAAAQPTVADAAATVRQLAVDVRRPRDGWLPAIDRARSTFANELTTLGTALQKAGQVTRVVPAMLGSDRPLTYFVGFLNEAESRGTGGLPGAFAIARVDRGRISFTRFETDDILRDVVVNVDLGADYRVMYGLSRSTLDFRDSNVSPSFPDPARIWAAMWQKKTGQHIDAAMAIDPTALSYLLAVTGPAALPDGTSITSKNVVGITENSDYRHYPPDKAGQARRKLRLISIAKAVTNRLFTPSKVSSDLLRAGGKAIKQRRLVLWSSDSTSEAALVDLGVGGVISPDATPFASVLIENAAGGKLDYYLHRTLTWKRSGCGPTSSVTATITLTNDSPATGLSAYSTSRLDKPSYPVRPGDNRLLVYYYATSQARLLAGYLDGVRVDPVAYSQAGHPVFGLDVELPRGRTRTLVLTIQEPHIAAPLTTMVQPAIHPTELTVDSAHC